MAKLKTGRHTSALKELRKSVRRHERNLSVRTKIKTLVKKVEDAVAKKDTTLAKTLLNDACGQWDKAAKRNVIHANAASNQKARLSKLVHTLSK
ncbi:MAG: 30S ribosomal protein S20 [Elusimicrobia bacterium RIFOXYA2_FULL_50_26]|nr:MAG: 30S ribosomal protein S20 [Elusimicrobia bacterium RIFOXYA2_FULL_50_26]OGS25010.1 MAG: 30S ribosomal protein S20 [Elusimicrobia bacterium RIFOXYB2_FULL_50_12]